jgi:cation:H+ antiporter
MSHTNSDALLRDWPVVMLLTVGLFFMAYGYGRQVKIRRHDGTILLLSFLFYNNLLKLIFID